MKDEHLRIRAARPADAQAIAHVHVDGWRVAYRGLMPAELLDKLDVGEREQRWRERILNDSTGILVAESAGRVVGFCFISASQDEDASRETGEIGAIYLRPEVWRRGIGGKLCERALDRLAKRGFSQATLWVLEANDSARRFYEAHGFALDGTGGRNHHCGAWAVRYRRGLGDRR